MSNTLFDHSDMWTNFRNEETGLEDWKRVRDMADKNIRCMEK